MFPQPRLIPIHAPHMNPSFSTIAARDCMTASCTLSVIKVLLNQFCYANLTVDFKVVIIASLLLLLHYCHCVSSKNVFGYDFSHFLFTLWTAILDIFYPLGNAWSAISMRARVEFDFFFDWNFIETDCTCLQLLFLWHFGYWLPVWLHILSQAFLLLFSRLWFEIFFFLRWLW